MQGKDLKLEVGYCHPVIMPVPEGIEVKCERQIITISGSDKHAVGQFAANVRSKRKPEPYKGKGIKYVEETILRKQGKAFGA
jgi:large subunit ribosomal protein L6